MKYRGNIKFDAGRLRGWILGPDDSTVTLRAVDRDSGMLVWEGPANDPRPNSRFSNTFCGFDFACGGPAASNQGVIEIQDAETNQPVPFSPFQFDETHAKHAQKLNELMQLPFVHLSGVVDKNGAITAKIVFIPKPETDLTCETGLFVRTKKGLHSVGPEKLLALGRQKSVSASRFWFSKVWPNVNFTLNLNDWFEDALIDESGTRFVQLTVENDSSTESVSTYRDAGLVDIAKICFPPIDGFRRTQVSGDLDQKFTASAFSQYRTYRKVYETYSGKSWFEIQKMLDWGCGCGRVTQPVVHSLGKERVFGTDIDATNIDWCRENLYAPNYAPCDINPPLPYQNNTFDYIIATSVLTHIPGPLVPIWLTELERVMKPGAIAALSVGGNPRVAFGSYSMDRLSELQQNGIEDSIQNAQLDSVISDKDYYRNVRMTPDYIHSVWGEHFEILAICPHAIGVQDIVICQKKS